MSNHAATTTWSPAEAIEAIQARMRGEFDNAQLKKLGPLGYVIDDVAEIVDHTTSQTSLPAEVATGAAPNATTPPQNFSARGVALGVIEALATSPVLQGFDDDEEVNGADAVDVLAEVWASIRAVVPRRGR